MDGGCCAEIVQYYMESLEQGGFLIQGRARPLGGAGEVGGGGDGGGDENGGGRGGERVKGGGGDLVGGEAAEEQRRGEEGVGGPHTRNHPARAADARRSLARLDPPRRRGDGEERRAGAVGASGSQQGRRAGVAGAVGGRQEGGEWRGRRRHCSLSATAAPYPPPPLSHRARPPTPLLRSHTRPPKPPLRHCARPPTPPFRLLWPPFWCGGGSFGDEAGRFRSNGSSEQRGTGASSPAPEVLSS
ncbi:hypothetical protein [Oryza sativa Japonica Group]|uniref:Uncharacterized protein n=1 Tax=Oryza sativa subsp. japonica TaxID=39947 RepID=Q5SNI1_ORYSJ|nr:hypothetical protein [Oryza sativa Japonica Group]